MGWLTRALPSHSTLQLPDWDTVEIPKIKWSVQVLTGFADRC